MKLNRVSKQTVLILLAFFGQFSLSASAFANEQPLSRVLDQISEAYEVIITYNSRLLSDIEVSFRA